MRKKLIIFLRCKLLGDHKWTSAGVKGEELKLDHSMNGQQITEAMGEYSRMYCDRCGHNSRLNQKMKDIFTDYKD